MQIIENFLQGKRPDQTLCEDGWVVTEHWAAVVDGSTSKVPGRAGGKEAMQLVCSKLRTMPADVAKEELLQTITRELAAHHVPESAGNAEYRPTCSAVIYHRSRRVVWLVGDCQCRFGGRTYTHPKLVDEVLTRTRCDVVRYLLANGYTAEDIRKKDLGRAVIFDALREQTNFQNDPNPFNPYRYPVFDGTPVDPELVPEIAVPEDVREIVLASDGYPELADTWQQTEDRLQELLEADPLCYRENPATKCLMEGNLSFDDRCYLRLALND